MGKCSRVWGLCICLCMIVFGSLSLKAEASNVITGTLGKNGEIQWSYDTDSKILTLTGEDKGELGNTSDGSVFKSICPDVEKIIVKDCTVYSCEAMFMGLKNVQSITFENFNTFYATNMEYMFSDCTALAEVDLSGINTSNVRFFNSMFRNCSSLTSLDLSGFDTSKSETMSNMFLGCSALTEVDLSDFNTMKVTDMKSMFSGCSKLKELDLSSFNMGNVTQWKKVFEECDALEVVKSPNVMVDKRGNIQKLELPGVFEDEYGNLTVELSKDFCNRTLHKIGSAKVRDFVERMYTMVLYRSAETQGLNEWTKRLLDKEIDGATLVDMFVNSDEFVARNTTDEEYVKILYNALLNRVPDAYGQRLWTSKLADDWSRDYILECFVYSTEFKGICDAYGIVAAFDPTAESQVRSFVKRMYTIVLCRRADAVGLEEWTQRLINGAANGAQIAEGFIGSDEFMNRNLSDERYVKVLYRAFFNREPDEEGFNLWMNELAKGASRRDVMKGFVHSVEFSDLCAQYGIIRGEIQ